MLRFKRCIICYLGITSRFLSLLNFTIVLSAMAITAQSVVAADGTNCTTSECNYSIPLDKPGFYIVAATLPSGQKEGLYNLLIDPSVPYAQASFVTHVNGFHGGGLLREGGQTPSWLGFSLAQFEPVNVTIYNHSSATPLDLILTNNSHPEQMLLKFGPILATHAQTYTVPALEPGFYVASVRSYPGLPKTAYSISIGANNLFGGVSGGWLDANNVGWGGFYMIQPRNINFKVQFGNFFGEMGVGLPNVQIYYQKSDGTQELKWSSQTTSIPTTTSSVIITKVTDTQTKLNNIIMDAEQKYFLAVYGEKDTQGNPKSVTNLVSIKQNPLQSIRVSFEDAVGTTPKTITVDLNAGKKFQITNYNPVKSTVSLTFLERDTSVATAEQPDRVVATTVEQPIDSVLAGYISDPFKGLEENLLDESFGLIHSMAGMFCDVAPGIIQLSSWLGEATGQGSACEPFKDKAPVTRPPSCETQPISNLNLFGSAIGDALKHVSGSNWGETAIFLIDAIPTIWDRLNTIGKCDRKGEQSDPSISTGCNKPKNMELELWCKDTGTYYDFNYEPHCYQSCQILDIWYPGPKSMSTL